MPVNEAQFRAQVALDRLDVDSEEEAQQFVADFQREIKKPATRKRVRSKAQAAKHKQEQRERKKARDPQGYKDQKKRRREAYKSKKK